MRTRLFAALACLAGLSGPAWAEMAAGPPLWQVSDADSKVFLFGSVHLLPPDTDWRTALFDRTLDGADKVYFETDIGPQAQAGLAGTMLMLGLNMNGRRIVDYLSVEEQEKLAEVSERIGMQLVSLQPMKPWFASMTLSTAALLKEGYDPNSGVDIQLQQELPEARKAYLETAREQIDVLAGLSEEAQVDMLVQSLDQIDEAGPMLDKMVQGWLGGDPDSIADLFMDELGADQAELADRLLYARNRNWVARIETMLADNEQSLIVVGTGHLLGDDGVPELLEKAGFTVERLQ